MTVTSANNLRHLLGNVKWLLNILIFTFWYKKMYYNHEFLRFETLPVYAFFNLYILNSSKTNASSVIKFQT